MKKETFRKIAMVLMATSCLALPYIANAQVVPHDNSTQVYKAPNGVPIVDIAKTSPGGLSHNRFNDYNVGTKGLVLNNGNTSEMTRDSQLAGQVPANLNLTTEASVILNEVVMPNRSTLAGYTEVVGKAADVIVANPYGITCNGCGFINTPNVTLTTGAPQLAAGGVVSGFRTEDGDILITGNGLDASQSDYLALLSRAVVINGQINAKALDIVAGGSDFDYDTKTVTTRATAGVAPTLAIDSSALGGMYANRIRLIATEAGVGVRMRGEAAANASDFTINAAGKVTLNGKISAKRDLKIETSANGADAIAATDAKLLADRDITLLASAGQLHLQGGTLSADHDITLSGNSLLDETTATAVTDNNKRYAVNKLFFESASTITLDGVSYGAGADLSGQTGTLTIGAQGAKLYSDGILSLHAGSLALNKAGIKSDGDMTLTAVGGSVVTQADAAQGIQSVNGNIALTADGGLTNAGIFTTDNGDVLFRVGGTINSSGTVDAGGDLFITDATGARTETVTNSGKMIAAGDMSLQAASASNASGGFIQGGQSLLVSLTGAFTNNGTTILQNTAHTGTATVIASALTNNGMLYSANDLDVTTSGGITNGGTLAANHDLDIDVNGNFFNNDGVIYGGNLVDIYSAVEFFNRSAGTVDSGNDIIVSTGTFRNYNNIIAHRNLTIGATSFYNEVDGGDQRVWTFGTPGTPVDAGWTGGFLGADPTWLLPGESSDRNFTQTWSDVQSYTVTPTEAMRAQLIAGSALNVTGFSIGKNLGSIMSAPTINLTGTGGASFVNDAYGLQTINYTKKWHHHATCCSFRDVVIPVVNITFNIQDGTTSTTSNTSGPGASIFANVLNAAGFGLTNLSGLKAANPAATTGSGTGFGGITITLPTNPNGFFVVNRSPTARYLIETNPLFTNPNFMSSDYMAQRLGMNVDTLQRRLGDANYEAYLIRQQLIAQIGTNVIEAGGDEAAQMQKLMDSGVDQANKLGLTYGQAPTEAQLASLGSDMVWMVETEVDGQKVLAPVVYLSAATKSMFETGGAVIAANTVNMNLDSVTNQGGTIQGTETLNITSRGDIKNLSGTIKGGNVDLTSTEGSIVNETYAKTTGSDVHMDTDIGKTAGIEATGNLNLDAKKNITNKGANVTAGGDASLKAGEDIVFDTIEDKKATTTSSSSRSGVSFDKTTTTESSTTNIASNLKVGGNLKTESGKDTVIRGSNVDVAGNADIKAGGDLKVLDVQDVKHTSTSKSTSGVGVGGGLWGAGTSEDTHTKKTSKGSNINIGGDAKLETDNTMTVQGSTIETGGNLDLKAKEIQILEGRNEETTTHTETVTTFGKVDMGEGFEPEEEEEEEEEDDIGGVSAKASAEAKTGHDDHGGVTLNETSATTTVRQQSTAAGSSIKSGGNMNIEAENDVTVRGSDVEAGGDVDVKAKNVNVLAAQNTDTTTTTNTTSKVGLYGTTSNEAGASAEAEAHAAAEGKGSPQAGASAGAEAGAKTTNTVDLVRVDETTHTSQDVTHTGGSIKSGGNTTIKADNKLKVHGSSLESGGDMTLEAEDMSFTAATDSHTETHDGSHTRTGLYADADASADAGASANVKGMTADAGAEANAGANAGIGLYGTNTTQGSVSGTTTAQTSSIKSGGNLTRKADNNITDVGTQIEAGGDFTQESKTWDSKAAENTTFSTSNSESNTARLGLYAEANAEAQGSADSLKGVDHGAGAGASAGVAASYNRTTSDKSSNSSEAVVSNIKSGGNMKTTTTGKTSLEGTNLESGGDMELNADSLDYKAARNTESESKGSTNADASLKVGIDATKAVTGTLAGGYGEKSSSSSSSTAVVGGMKSGGNLKVNTKGDANFEGTNIEAGGDAGIDAGGDVNFNAAHNTATSTETDWNVSASISASKTKSASGNKSGQGFEAEGGYSTSKEESDEAVAGSIKSGGKLNVKSGNNATFEGTKLESGGDATVGAKNDVTFNAAESTASSSGWGVEASLSGSKGGSRGQNGKTRNRESEVEGGISGGYSESSERTSDVASIKSGGNLKVKAGNDANFEGTNIEADGSADIEADNDVNFTAATDTRHSVGFSAGAEGVATKEGADENGDGVKYQKESKGKAGFELSGEESVTRTGGSIKAKTIGIKSGNDTTLEGTSTESKGDTTINAGGDVNLKAAESSHIDGGIGMGIGGKSAGLTRASIDGGVDQQGVTMKSGNDVNITSSGKTVMQGTQIETDGDANINAQGGVEKSLTTSAGANLGLDHAGGDVDVKGVNIVEHHEDNSAVGDDSNALKAVFSKIQEQGPDIVPPSEAQNDIKNAIEHLDYDESLTPEQRTQKREILQQKLENQKAIDLVKQDPNLTKAQKDKLLKELKAKQKELDK